MTDMPSQTVTTGPMFSLTRAGQLADRTGQPLDLCIRYLEGQAEGKSETEIVVANRERFIDTDLEGGSKSPFALSKAISAIRVCDRSISETEALADGKLWTILAFLKPGSVSIVIANGRIDAGHESILAADHKDSHGTMTTTVMGEKIDARRTAAECVNSDHIDITFL